MPSKRSPWPVPLRDLRERGERRARSCWPAMVGPMPLVFFCKIRRERQGEGGKCSYEPVRMTDTEVEGVGGGGGDGSFSQYRAIEVDVAGRRRATQLGRCCPGRDEFGPGRALSQTRNASPARSRAVTDKAQHIPRDWELVQQGSKNWLSRTRLVGQRDTKKCIA